MTVFGVTLVRTQSECVKIPTRITSNKDTFHAVIGTTQILLIQQHHITWLSYHLFKITSDIFDDDRRRSASTQIFQIKNFFFFKSLNIYETWQKRLNQETWRQLFFRKKNVFLSKTKSIFGIDIYFSIGLHKVSLRTPCAIAELDNST